MTKVVDWLKTLWWCSPLALPLVLAEQHVALERLLLDLLLKDLTAQLEHRAQSQRWRDRMIG